LHNIPESFGFVQLSQPRADVVSSLGELGSGIRAFKEGLAGEKTAEKKEESDDVQKSDRIE